MDRHSARVCMTCGHIGEPGRVTPGSFGVELVLWLCFLVPGLIYSIWRISARRDACTVCAGAVLLPLDAPVAQRLVAELGMQSAVTVPRKPSPAAYGFGKRLGQLLRRG